MSEYQYYEFRAIDRSLTKEEMAELRAVSTRAVITPTSFTNEYNYGNFRGDPEKLVEKYFDAFVYVTNWGTHQFMLRLPSGLIDRDLASEYAVDEHLDVYTKGDHVILDFQSQDEGGGGWEEGEGWLDALVPLRDDLQRGDLRALYLGWLAYASWGPITGDDDEIAEEDEEVEPPVPPGLGKLSPPLRKLAEFLRIDDDLLKVAATASGERREAPSTNADLARWVSTLPDSEKNAALIQLMEGEDIRVRADLLRRYRQQSSLPAATRSGLSEGRRTVTELCTAAHELTETRRRQEAERAAQTQAQRVREEAAARATYLADLAGRQEATWRRIETLIDLKRPAEYDQAVQFLIDLRDVAAQGLSGSLTSEEFDRRVRDLRARHAKKVSFLNKLKAARF